MQYTHKCQRVLGETPTLSNDVSDSVESSFFAFLDLHCFNDDLIFQSI